MAKFNQINVPLLRMLNGTILQTQTLQCTIVKGKAMDCATPDTGKSWLSRQHTSQVQTPGNTGNTQSTGDRQKYLTGCKLVVKLVNNPILSMCKWYSRFCGQSTPQQWEITHDLETIDVR